MATKTAEKKKGIARVLTIIDGIKRTPFRRSDKKGFDAEDEVLRQGKYLEKKKLISAVKLFERFSQPDQAGKDLIIELLTGKKIYVSITATYHREDELRAQRQGVFYLPVYPYGINADQAAIEKSRQNIRKNLYMIILYSYFSELEMRQARDILNKLNEPRKGPDRLERLWRLFRSKKS